MVSYLLWPLAVLGAVFWVALPTGVLVMAIFYRGTEALDTLQWCRGYDPTNPAAEPCWVPAGEEYCPRHAASAGIAFNP